MPLDKLFLVPEESDSLIQDTDISPSSLSSFTTISIISFCFGSVFWSTFLAWKIFLCELDFYLNNEIDEPLLLAPRSLVLWWFSNKKVLMLTIFLTILIYEFADLNCCSLNKLFYFWASMSSSYSLNWVFLSWSEGVYISSSLNSEWSLNLFILYMLKENIFFFVSCLWNYSLSSSNFFFSSFLAPWRSNFF